MRGTSQNPISRTGCCDPSRGDGESAFAQPKDTRSADLRQETWLPLSLLRDCLREDSKFFQENRRHSVDSWPFTPTDFNSTRDFRTGIIPTGDRALQFRLGLHDGAPGVIFGRWLVLSAKVRNPSNDLFCG